MEELDYWRLCEELNIVQASLLVVGEDPSCAGYTEDQEIQNRPKATKLQKQPSVVVLKILFVMRKRVVSLNGKLIICAKNTINHMA